MKRVLIAGGYDIIHSGHIFRINQARTYGGHLTVNITPDNRMKNKGENRPYLSQEERILIVGSIKGVDEVVCIPSEGENHLDYEKKLIETVRPDIFITELRDGLFSNWEYQWEDYGYWGTHKGCQIILLPETVGIDKKHSSDIIKTNQLKK
jgi:cytidyltransferase-like protein